jgi:sugar phosphate isomerase/epimerase
VEVARVGGESRSVVIGVVLEALADDGLREALSFLREQAPEVTEVEIGVGGYAPTGHCDMQRLLADERARVAWSELVASFGFTVSALNAWGNPLHPDEAIARRHRQDIADAVRLAASLGVKRVVALAGCPGAVPGDRAPHFAAGGWLPYLEGVWERQWAESVEECWSSIAAVAESEDPELRVCLELHPGTVVYNVETFERVAQLSPAIAANLDPSHLFWMQMDPLRVVEHLGSSIAYSHAKDASFNDLQLSLNGVLDARWPSDPELLPWNFSVPGRGHDHAWWASFVRALRTTSATTLAIECEDPFVPPRQGIPEASSFLKACGAGTGMLR